MNRMIRQLHWFVQHKRRKANIRKGGYSQYGQDITVFELLGKPPQGVFLDIGANDGKTYSNSLLFQEKGWTGVCVEPHPIIFEALRENRNCELVNACIANKDGIVNFLVVDGPANMLSGILEFCDTHHKERIEKEMSQTGGNKRIIPIEALSPTTLCSRFNINQIDFLSIDTEGCELPILKSFDFEKTPVRMVSVENGSRSPAVFRYLTSKGFHLVKCIGCDEIYRHQFVLR